MAIPHDASAVQNQLKALPAQPGCYIYRDETGEVLYVGKALSLKSRVRSYFQKSTRHSNRIARMVAKVRNIEWIVVDSEVEALVLECNLIKRHRPPFNVRLRDDKSYPYIIITNERFPRVLFTRRLKRGDGKYFGPYTSAFFVRETLQVLHKVFQLIPCGKSWTGAAIQKPCLYYHLGQCLAPCAGLSDPEAYKKVVLQVERFLSGRFDELVVSLREEMEQSAESLDYERAASIRDRLTALVSIQERQKVLSHDQEDRDVVALVKDDRGAAIEMLYVRGGKLVGQRHFTLDGASEASPTSAVQEFVKQYYSESPEIPREILLPVEIEERNIVLQWLRAKRGSAVTVEVPQGGEKLKLVEMAASNAEQALVTMQLELDRQEAWAEEAASQIQEAVGLMTLPERIECYDISNIQGTAPVGSMVVTLKGTPAKSGYRRFRVRFHPESPNDFAMMHEVLSRRLRAYLDGDEKFKNLPDLIVIDGGKGQLSAAIKARDALGLVVPMVGLAKKLELVYYPVEVPTSDVQDVEGGIPRPVEKSYAYEVAEMPLHSPGLTLMRRLRDEAHRFALSYHRKVRDKRFSGSALEEIPGVGPRRKRLLLRTFGSLAEIRRASVEELAAVPTMTKRLAEQVRDYLQDGTA